MDKSIGARMKKIREDAGLSQKAFGARLQASLPTINRCENGHRLPETALVIRIAEEFNCDLQWLLTGSETSPSGADRVPIVSRVPEDFSSILSDEVKGYLSMPGLPKGTFAIQIRGEEMVPSVRPGDHVIFQRGDVETGRLVVAIDQWGAFLVRRLREVKGDLLLTTDDPQGHALLMEKAEFVGPVLEIIRRVVCD